MDHSLNSVLDKEESQSYQSGAKAWSTVVGDIAAAGASFCSVASLPLVIKRFKFREHAQLQS